MLVNQNLDLISGSRILSWFRLNEIHEGNDSWGGFTLWSARYCKHLFSCLTSLLFVFVSVSSFRL